MFRHLKPRDSSSSAVQAILHLTAEAVGCSRPLTEVPTTLDWELVEALAKRGYSLPLIGWLSSANPKVANPEFRESSIRAYRNQRDRAEWFAVVRTYIRDCLSDIDFVFRKGPHAETLYPDIGCRPYNDFDILTDQESVAIVIQRLRGIGFEILNEFTRAQQIFLAVATEHGTPLCFSTPEKPDVHVDVAYGNIPPALRAPGSVIQLKNQDSVVHKDLLVPVLTNPWFLLDLVCNVYATCTVVRYARRFRFARFTYYLDIALASRIMAHDDWLEFDSIVARLGLQRAVDYAFLATAQLYPDVGLLMALERRLSPSAGRILDEVGAEEFANPYVWEEPFLHRLGRLDLPADFPKSTWPM